MDPQGPKNPSAQPYNPPPLPLPAPTAEEAAEPIAENASAMQVVEGLLKSFESIMGRLQAGGHARVLMHLCTIFFVAFLGYGLVVGSFSGEMQWLYAPAKILIGMMLCCVFCYPSLFIFTCLSGADLRPGQVAALLLSCVSLAAILLVGFAPVAWVFSQSTNSLFFMGLLHLVFFMMAIIFGLKLIGTGMQRGGAGYDYVGVWKIIFIVTILQMSTSLRPIIGTSDELVTAEKKFFMEHWSDVASNKHPSRSKPESMRSTVPPTTEPEY